MHTLLPRLGDNLSIAEVAPAPPNLFSSGCTLGGGDASMYTLMCDCSEHRHWGCAHSHARGKHHAGKWMVDRPVSGLGGVGAWR